MVLESLRMDVWYGIQMLRRSPGFRAGAVLSLAFDTGANTAIFSLIDTVLLQTLSLREPEQFVISQRRDITLGYDRHRRLRDRTQLFSGVLGYSPVRLSPTVDGRLEGGHGTRDGYVGDGENAEDHNQESVSGPCLVRAGAKRKR